MNKKATITLKHNQFQVDGPPELVIWISSLQRIAKDVEAMHAAYMTRLADYYVNCSVTGEEIPLSELKYWNVEKQEYYKTPAIGSERYTEIMSST